MAAVSARRNLVQVVRRKMRATVDNVDLVGAACGLCNRPDKCASVTQDGAELRLCFACLYGLAQFVAAGMRAKQRPHVRPCTCEPCGLFDQGQRGEVNTIAPTRWNQLEVDA